MCLIDKANIHFSHLFGDGCKYSSGEDSLFLIDCFRKGLRVYSYDGLIGDNIRDSSTWFRGYTEKFFYDRGAFAACAFPKLKYIVCIYYLFAYRKVRKCSVLKMLKLMYYGTRGYKFLLTYGEWERKRKNE